MTTLAVASLWNRVNELSQGPPRRGRGPVILTAILA
jgi:hypothetical protein